MQAAFSVFVTNKSSLHFVFHYYAAPYPKFNPQSSLHFNFG
ncbi:hypothetical protein [Kingella kingae]|nr:hypothetical protein [Kingella kingae]MDK4530973.1 hypothetical protein [Kingella kingae]